MIIDGRLNAQQNLLQQGLAQAITVPPDLWQQDCYQLAEDQARNNGLGVWALDYFRAHTDVQRGGFQLIGGKVDHVGKTTNSVWLDLAGDVSLRIARDDWRYFPDQDWGRWQGRDIVARGWLYRSRHKWQLRIRHPQNIIVRSEE